MLFLRRPDDAKLGALKYTLSSFQLSLGESVAINQHGVLVTNINADACVDELISALNEFEVLATLKKEGVWHEFIFPIWSCADPEPEGVRLYHQFMGEEVRSGKMKITGRERKWAACKNAQIKRMGVDN